MTTGRRGIMGFTGDRFVLPNYAGSHPAAIRQAARAGGVLATRAQIAQLDKKLADEKTLREKGDGMAGEDQVVNGGIRHLGSVEELRRQAILGHRRTEDAASVGHEAALAADVKLSLPEAKTQESSSPELTSV